MEALQPEWNEFLELLRRRGVRFVIVGALAMAAHGRPRYTQDLDVLVDTTEANARRLRTVLAEYGYASAARAWRRFTKPYQIFTLGREPLRIDILTSISGVSFRTAWRNRVAMKLGGGQLDVLGLVELRTNKAAAGRPKDLLDLALLDELVPIRAKARSRSSSRRRAARPSRTRGTVAPRR